MERPRGAVGKRGREQHEKIHQPAFIGGGEGGAGPGPLWEMPPFASTGQKICGTKV